MRACLRACVPACLHTYMHACMHAYIHTYIHTNTCIYIHVCTDLCMYICIYIYTYIVCICIYTYTRICLKRVCASTCMYLLHISVVLGPQSTGWAGGRRVFRGSRGGSSSKEADQSSGTKCSTASKVWCLCEALQNRALQPWESVSAASLLLPCWQVHDALEALTATKGGRARISSACYACKIYQ